MIVESTHLGSMTVSEDHILKFPKGLPGFESETAFAMVEYQENTPFTYLQSVTTPDLTFIAADPFAFFAEYQIDIDQAAERELAVNSDNPPYILCIITIPQSGVKDMTINLLAPIVVNTKTLLAKQVVLTNVPYTTRHRLFVSDPKVEGGV